VRQHAAEITPIQECTKKTRSGFKGVFPNGSGWLAKIKDNGKTFYLGTFSTPSLAHEAYCKSAREIHGEFMKAAAAAPVASVEA
jgi:hypothetical protein